MNEENTSNSPQQGSGVTGAVKTEAEKLMSTTRHEAGQTAGKVKEEAKAAAGHLQDAGRRFALHQKDALAQKADEVAQAVRAASERLRDNGQAAMLAGPAESAAEQLGRLSGFLKNSDTTELIVGLEQAARRRPELVFGGLFLAGLLAGRFIKSSGRRLHPAPGAARSSPYAATDVPPLRVTTLPPSRYAASGVQPHPGSGYSGYSGSSLPASSTSADA